MISVVCVYNNERSLRNVLLKSLERQTVEFELITIDNRGGRFKSAAEALNYGGEKAKGDYIMFVHQDMWLGSNTWLEDVEDMLRSIPDLGVAGVAGMSDKGKNQHERRRWCIEDVGELSRWSPPVNKPEEVQTLDECLLVVPRPVFARLKFDENTFDGWDSYGADYCLCARNLGFLAFVIPAYCGHSCLRAHYLPWEFKDLPKYETRLFAKHRKEYKHIYSFMREISWTTPVWRKLAEFYGRLSFRLFPVPWMTLKKQLYGCHSLLDLGCGCFSLAHRFDIPFSVGVESYEPYLQESRRKAIHSQYVKADIRSIEFKPRSFDAVIATDVVEHLTKEEGYELIGRMAEWARKKVVIKTPNGRLWNGTYHDHPVQQHRSGWGVHELQGLGFKVFGLNGWKRLGGYDHGAIRYRPAFVWSKVSALTQLITRLYPKLAFELLAVKQIDRNHRE